MVEENYVERPQGRRIASHPHGFPTPKLEIPMFDGTNPRWWVHRCERMFCFYGVLEQQRVTLAVTYLNDAGDAWFQGWIGTKEGCRWAEFVEGLCERFGDRNMLDVVEEFNKLRQEVVVQGYQSKFEELKSLMIILYPHLTEGYFVSNFVSGLSEELMPIVKMQQLRTVK